MRGGWEWLLAQTNSSNQLSASSLAANLTVFRKPARKQHRSGQLHEQLEHMNTSSQCLCMYICAVPCSMQADQNMLAE